MGVYGINRANQPVETTTVTKPQKYNQEPPKTEGTVQFKGGLDADTFEKKEKHTGRNIAIGTAIGTVALATAAAFLGKYGIKFKDPGNFFTRGINTIIDGCHTGASWLKANTWTALKNRFFSGGSGTGGGTLPPTP